MEFSEEARGVVSAVGLQLGKGGEHGKDGGVCC